jgi:hypothetical protein
MRGRQLQKKKLPPLYSQFLYTSSPKQSNDSNISCSSTHNISSPVFVSYILKARTNCLDTVHSDTNHLDISLMKTTDLETVEVETAMDTAMKITMETSTLKALNYYGICVFWYGSKIFHYFHYSNVQYLIGNRVVEQVERLALRE